MPPAAKDAGREYAQKAAPAQWRDEITLWLESLTAAGLSQDTVNTRRCKIATRRGAWINRPMT